jgi:hypothetical protein
MVASLKLGFADSEQIPMTERSTAGSTIAHIETDQSICHEPAPGLPE